MKKDDGYEIYFPKLVKIMEIDMCRNIFHHMKKTDA